MRTTATVACNARSLSSVWSRYQRITIFSRSYTHRRRYEDEPVGQIHEGKDEGPQKGYTAYESSFFLTRDITHQHISADVSAASLRSSSTSLRTVTSPYRSMCRTEESRKCSGWVWVDRSPEGVGLGARLPPEVPLAAYREDGLAIVACARWEDAILVSCFDARLVSVRRQRRWGMQLFGN